jgi:hypothetical protein
VPARGGCYNAAMTYVEVTYDLQSPLQDAQLSALSQMANVFGLRRFQVDRERNQIHLEYDGSRLKEFQLVQILRQANIAIAQRA